MPGVHGSATPGYPIEATKGRGYHPHPSRLAGPSSHQPPSSILFLSLPSSSHPAHRIASGHRHPPCSLPPGGTGMFIATRWHRNVHCLQVAPECSLPPGGTEQSAAACRHEPTAAPRHRGGFSKCVAHAAVAISHRSCIHRIYTYDPSHIHI